MLPLLHLAMLVHPFHLRSVADLLTESRTVLDLANAGFFGRAEGAELGVEATAAMAVMDAADYTRSCNEMLADMEFTIIHELIHLELASLPKSEASRSNEEFAVNRLAEALLGR